MEVAATIMGSRDVASLVRHNEYKAEPKPSVLDVHGATCVHQAHPMAPMCGAPVLNENGMKHGWLCGEHQHK